MLISIIAWLIVGAVAGWLASMVMKTNAAQGTIQDIIVGIIGAFIGGFVFDLLGFEATADAAGSFSIIGVFVAFIGAVILLAILKFVRRAT